VYINFRRHYLSKAICISAIAGLAGQVLNAFSRIIFNSNPLRPDMLNNSFFGFSIVIQLIVVFLIFGVFLHYIRKIKQAIYVIDEDDLDEVAMLQKKYIPNTISTLKGESIYQLLEIWAVILIFVQIISLVSNYEYKRFISGLYELLPVYSADNAVTFAEIYNYTHGFKYIGMFSAIIIGIFVTAVFLQDRFLKILATVITFIFILAFMVFQMVTFETQIKIISIVWTAVIYHGLETLGLFAFSLYLAKHYRGL